MEFQPFQQYKMKKLELIITNLERVSKWIEHADQKVGVALVFQAGLITFLTTGRLYDIKAILYKKCDFSPLFLLFLLFLFIIFIVKATYYSFKALYPDPEERERSFFFFGSIANMQEGKFKKDFLSLTDEEVEEDLNNQVFINSKIAKEKFKNVKKAIYNTVLTTIFWALSLILIAFLK